LTITGIDFTITRKEKLGILIWIRDHRTKKQGNTREWLKSGKQARLLNPADILEDNP